MKKPREKATAPQAVDVPPFVMPSIAHLRPDPELAAKVEEFNAILNGEPHPSWLEDHPTATKRVLLQDGSYQDQACKYLSVQRMEWLLTSLFLGWDTDVKQTQVFNNYTVVTVRVTVTNPVTGVRQYQDGIGVAVFGLPTDQQRPANFASAIQMAPPCAKTLAFKDAVEGFGKIFGKDLNRTDKVFYDNVTVKQEKAQGHATQRDKSEKAANNLEDKIKNNPTLQALNNAARNAKAPEKNG